MKKRRAQSVVEILFAIGIMTVGITAALSIMTAVEDGTEKSSREMQAVFYAEEGIQATISISDRSWTELAIGAHGLAIGGSPVEWVFSGTSDSLNGMTRVVTITSVDGNTKKIDVTVTWHPAPNRTATVTEQMLVTNWAFVT